jgi:hypothetical protein
LNLPGGPTSEFGCLLGEKLVHGSNTIIDYLYMVLALWPTSGDRRSGRDIGLWGGGLLVLLLPVSKGQKFGG